MRRRYKGETDQEIGNHNAARDLNPSTARAAFILAMAKSKHGGTSRHKARGSAQRRTRRRKGMGGSGGGSGRRSTRSLRKRATRTGPKKSSVHAPKQARDKSLSRRRRR